VKLLPSTEFGSTARSYVPLPSSSTKSWVFSFVEVKVRSTLFTPAPGVLVLLLTLHSRSEQWVIPAPGKPACATTLIGRLLSLSRKKSPLVIPVNLEMRTLLVFALTELVWFNALPSSLAIPKILCLYAPLAAASQTMVAEELV